MAEVAPQKKSSLPRIKMRLFNRQRTWRFRSSLIVSAIISTLLVPATLLVTADPAYAAVEDYYCGSYSGYAIMVNDNSSGTDGDYTVSRLTISGVGHNTIHTLDLPNNASINAVGISPVSYTHLTLPTKA